jgi:hypothetical protein
MALWGVAALPLVLGACTSDPTNRLGSSMSDPEFSADLVPLVIDSVSDYTALTIFDENVPLTRSQTLYLGSEDGLASSMLANYDFGNVFTDAYPDTLFTAEKIKSVKFSLSMLNYYGEARRTEDGVVQMFYNIYLLDAPFDTTETLWPGDVPPHDPRDLNANFLEEHGKFPLIDLNETDFLDWLAGGEQLGFLIQADPEYSDPGLVGYASREMRYYSQLDDVAVGTVVAPNFVVEFEDVTIPSYLMRPFADTSTFDVVDGAPADPSAGLMLQTGMRSYPLLTFDYSAIPANAYVNRATLWVTCDSLVSFGNLESIVVAEMDPDLYTAPADSLTLAGFNTSVYTLSGQSSVDPTTLRHVSLDVTQAVQRAINNVYEGRRGLVLAAGEDIFPRYDLTITDPDFYVTRFMFFGTAADDSLRPRLQIAYSLIEELEVQP